MARGIGLTDLFGGIRSGVRSAGAGLEQGARSFSEAEEAKKRATAEQQRHEENLQMQRDLEAGRTQRADADRAVDAAAKGLRSTRAIEAERAAGAQARQDQGAKAAGAMQSLSLALPSIPGLGSAGALLPFMAPEIASTVDDVERMGGTQRRDIPDEWVRDPSLAKETKPAESLAMKELDSFRRGYLGEDPGKLVSTLALDLPTIEDPNLSPEEKSARKPRIINDNADRDAAERTLRRIQAGVLPATEEEIAYLQALAGGGAPPPPADQAPPAGEQEDEGLVVDGVGRVTRADIDAARAQRGPRPLDSTRSLLRVLGILGDTPTPSSTSATAPPEGNFGDAIYDDGPLPGEVDAGGEDPFLSSSVVQQVPGGSLELGDRTRLQGMGDVDERAAARDAVEQRGVPGALDEGLDVLAERGRQGEAEGLAFDDGGATDGFVDDSPASPITDEYLSTAPPLEPLGGGFDPRSLLPSPASARAAPGDERERPFYDPLDLEQVNIGANTDIAVNPAMANAMRGVLDDVAGVPGAVELLSSLLEPGSATRGAFPLDQGQINAMQEGVGGASQAELVAGRGSNPNIVGNIPPAGAQPRGHLGGGALDISGRLMGIANGRGSSLEEVSAARAILEALQRRGMQRPWPEQDPVHWELEGDLAETRGAPPAGESEDMTDFFQQLADVDAEGIDAASREERMPLPPRGESPFAGVLDDIASPFVRGLNTLREERPLTSFLEGLLPSPSSALAAEEPMPEGDLMSEDLTLPEGDVELMEQAQRAFDDWLRRQSATGAGTGGGAGPGR